ncbi:hypothetical protein GUITHDRAFT_133270 [Guillardia theta CCMP2712]|uniref:Uncharacterized protein n=1 Tax=Guillardia theta (strain CCMP2712) TaxID=905079 RepID=L1JXC7_GUITC|nr:hypothetical protein GUITHDRAFT_133270 [Guillardia theta CCMP2712]EKX52845.1 hypothetical protein GUITHDRAFT_133270 [Guillardia theta CCMP2712]|eukprot:XP_005839825.1 hypothetical protein GUITHDRAFT_133270 [Guillardia theta CCMP2712]
MAKDQSIRWWILVCGTLQVIILNAMVVVSWTISYVGSPCHTGSALSRHLQVPIPTSLLLFVAMGLVFFGSFLQTFAALRIHGGLADCIMMVVSRRHFVEMIMVVLQALATVIAIVDLTQRWKSLRGRQLSGGFFERCY